MIRFSKETDERREAGPLECWCLHGAVGMAADFRTLAKNLAPAGISTRSIDLWRFLETESLALEDFGRALNDDAGSEIFRGTGRSLLGYSMGGRLALHALLEKDHHWQAAVIVSANPGLENELDRSARRAQDGNWAAKAFAGDWKKFLDEWNSQPVLGGGEIRDPDTAQRLIASRRQVAKSFIDWSLGAQEPLWERLSEIQIPVLWVAGENDPKYLQLAERATQALPKGVLAVAPGAGHRVPWQAGPWFADRVAHFLKSGA